MDGWQYNVVIPAKSLNLAIKYATDYEHVDLRFLVEHWHEVTSVAWNTKLVLKEGDDVATVARKIAEQAVEHDMLHHSLVEHAVLQAVCELKDKTEYDDDIEEMH